ncbi:hypothetical protein P0136_11310 [Lentisphaerota bacterium ZTH]|nr:hypothetical protein JYG24_11170 [Lentisphaerota bacterium]WET05946.1 hypothetical protein P0136_11310 [Lentisphaerota bacterium ZTH]
MSDNIMQVQCFNCQAVYEVEPEMSGQLVECAICEAVFMVPYPMEGMEGQIYATTPYVEEEQVREEHQADQDAKQESQEDFNPAVQNSTERSEQLQPEEPQVPNLETSADRKPASGVTNTVKLSRSSIGMMPSIEDSFSFSTVEVSPPALQVDKNEIETPSETLEKFGKNQTKPARKAVRKRNKKRWWELLFFWKK